MSSPVKSWNVKCYSELIFRFQKYLRDLCLWNDEMWNAFQVSINKRLKILGPFVLAVKLKSEMWWIIDYQISEIFQMSLPVKWWNVKCFSELIFILQKYFRFLCMWNGEMWNAFQISTIKRLKILGPFILAVKLKSEM